MAEAGAEIDSEIVDNAQYEEAADADVAQSMPIPEPQPEPEPEPQPEIQPQPAPVPEPEPEPAPAPAAAKAANPRPITLTLNDKFRFRRSLFGGSDTQMADTLAILGRNRQCRRSQRLYHQRPLLESRGSGGGRLHGGSSRVTLMLYIVPTPVGNLADMTPRALEVLEIGERRVCRGHPHQRSADEAFRHNHTPARFPQI